MVEKHMLNDDVAVDIPFKSYDQAEPKADDEPPQYQNPQADFSSGWKDIGFAIVFLIHVIIVIVLGLVLGLPVVSKMIHTTEIDKLEIPSTTLQIKPFVYSLSGAAAIGGIVSFIILFALQICAGYFIKTTFGVIIMSQVLMGVALFFIFPPLCAIPGFFVLITLIYLSCIRKRISFAEAHLQAGSASLRSHPSLILVAIFMLIVQLLWFVFWSLMFLGVTNTLNIFTPTAVNRTNDNMSNQTQVYPVRMNPMPIQTTTSYPRRNRQLTSSTPFWMKEKSTRKYSSAYSKKNYSESDNNKNSSASNQEQSTQTYAQKVVMFLLILSWYWGAITIGNIIHFIAACSVGDWWFSNEDTRHYRMGNSIKRAFTTNIGTIAFGSLFEAIIKTLRYFTSKDSKKSIVACIVDCILMVIEKIIGYLNEWAFVFAALTGQGFVQASRSFIDLFKKRGWTVVINDSIVGSVLNFISFGIGIISGVTGGCLMYFLTANIPEKIFYIVIVCILSVLIGIFVSSIITSLLMSCVRTVFVCFALNPAALGATHPEHLQKLTKAWHKFYPQEFASSGYANQYKEAVV